MWNIGVKLVSRLFSGHPFYINQMLKIKFTQFNLPNEIQQYIFDVNSVFQHATPQPLKYEVKLAWTISKFVGIFNTICIYI